jgi:uncharacterized protein YgiM (DUF1202 family)
MPILCGLRKVFMGFCLLLLISSCASQMDNIDTFYTIPVVTYLRECPKYDCPVVAEIYNADKVTVLEKDPGGWWRVQSEQSQKIGWTQPELLSVNPISAKTYYIAVDGLALRSSPAEDAVTRLLLGYGDRVQKVAEQKGWWFVVAEKDRSIGWIPEFMASEEPPEQREVQSARLVESMVTGSLASLAQPAAGPHSYFVAAETVTLHIIPSESSGVVKVLKLNDKVAKISQSGADWLKVRYLDTGAEGWAPVRFFKDSPVTDTTQIVQKKKKPAKKPRRQNQQAQDGLGAENLEPEGM